MAAQLRGLGSHPKGSASAPEPGFVSTSTRSTTGVATPACGPSRKGSSRAPRRLVKALQRDGAPLDDEGHSSSARRPQSSPLSSSIGSTTPRCYCSTSSGSTTGSLATQPRRSGPQKSCARARSSSCSMTTAWRTTNARLRSLTSTSSSPTECAYPRLGPHQRQGQPGQPPAAEPLHGRAEPRRAAQRARPRPRTHHLQSGSRPTCAAGRQRFPHCRRLHARDVARAQEAEVAEPVLSRPLWARRALDNALYVYRSGRRRGGGWAGGWGLSGT